jgi:hypothetical protein
MRDLEDLLRDTLTDPRRRIDPSPAMYEEVQHAARGRRHRRLAAGSAAVVVVAVAITTSVLALQGPASRTTPPLASHPPAPTHSVDPLRGTTGTAVPLGGDKFAAVMGAVATPTALYAYTTDIVKLDPTGTDVLATAPGPAGTPSGVAVDGNVLWAWSQDLGQVREYDAATLHVLDTFNTDVHAFSATAIGGELWLASDTGLYVLPANAPSSQAPTRVDDGAAYSVAADAARNRVIVGTMVPGGPADSGLGATQVTAIDVATRKTTVTGATVELGKTSIAVMDGQVWVGGYGSGDQPRIAHLDATSLQVVGSSEVSTQLGPGAILWPGQSVLWVRNGGDEGLSCVDPKTGKILEYWDGVQGPVTSITGHAYGVQGDLVRLNLSSACTG